ncbi:BON1-associated protein 2-like [Gastrolobium bilobum]|uniref:BON1-associated protein 2-like n=1 Tax=Gastrolobium bilobum TaxID=150636 RepID=UPI002AB24E66|nr:BON1-associated protein 2-like [Gastrolobium bilobum]
MGLSSRTLEITVISGENLSVTEDAYVVVRAESIKSCTTKMAKKSDGNNKNSSFISWNEKFLLDMSLHARSITFEVQCKKFKGARPLGVARIAVSDFLGGDVPENCLQVLSYGLRDWEGRRNGVIHFSVRVAAVSAVEPVKGMVACNKDAGDQLMGINVGDKNCNGVVVGVPFWWNYPNII